MVPSGEHVQILYASIYSQIFVMADTILLSSFNCRGIRNTKKRLGLFHWLKDTYEGIIFLQETHSIESDEKSWEREWGSKIYFSHCSSIRQGVAILMPLNIDVKVTNIESDLNGRLIALTCEIEGNEFVLLNIYAPTKDKNTMQNNFLNYLHSTIEKYSDKNLIIGGDFNVCLNPELDKIGGRYEVQSNYCKKLINLLEEYSLIDIWRLRNLTLKQYTRRDRSSLGLVQARLDYWFVSTNLQYNIDKTFIKPGYQSDHSILCFQLQLLETQKRGKGTWKFNNGLLNDRKYVELMKATISTALQEVNFENKNLLWEYLKCQIRSDTILYAGKKLNKGNKKKRALRENWIP